MYLKLSHNDIVYNSEFLIKDYSLKEIYYNNNLNQADNSASLTIPYDVEIQNFINLYSDSNIKGQIIDGENIVWTGYLRKNYNFGKKQRNTELKIELVSPSYLLNSKTQDYFVLQNTSLGLAVQTLLSKAGFTSTVELTEEIGLFQIHPDTEIKKALTDLLFSYGYCFDFDNEGRFIVFPIFNKPETITQVFDGNNCIDEIKVSKKEQTYNATSVEWELVEKVENKLIFADTTGGNNESNSCSITIQPGEYLGEVDSVGTYYIQYDCAEGKILNVTEGTLTIESTNNSGLTYSYNNLGNQGELSIYNKSSSPITITKLVVYGDAFVVKSTNFAKSSTGTNFKDLKSDYIHTKTFAENLAKNYTDWLNYADYTVNLKSYTDFALGSFVTVTENGLGTIQGRIIEKIYNIKNEPIQYQIEAISEYVPAEVNSYTKKQSSLLVKGIMGKDGKDGIDGKDGESVSITSTAIDYQSSASGTEIPTGAWLNYIPAVSNGNFLWCRTTVNYSDGTKTESFSVSYIPTNGTNGKNGVDGKDGKDAVSIKTITEYYLASPSNSGVTTSTTGWTETIQTVSSSKKYLWNYEKITFTDNSTLITSPVIIGNYAANGTNGTNGKDGKGIKSITEHYLATTASSGVSTSTSGWTTTVQTMTATNKYLWNYETITYTDSSTSNTSPSIIGVYGDKGEQGIQGVKGDKGNDGEDGISISINSTSVDYQSATSGTEKPTGAWLNYIPSVANGNYLWCRTTVNYSDGTKTESYSVSYIPKNGTNGTNGTNGKGIKSITNYYLASTSSSGVTTSTSGWTTTIQTVSSSKKYLWNYEKVTYTDNSTTSTSPVIIGNFAKDGANGTNGTNGKDGVNGTNGKDGVSISSVVEYYLATASGSGVTTSTSGWTTTIQTITATKKYLWNYEVINFSNSTKTTTSPAIIGVYGDKGQKGDTGSQGPQGATGATGATGPQGPQGAKGNTGVSMRNKGTWASGTAYVNNSSYIDVVYYASNGCSYSCIKSHTASSSILPTNTTYWSLIAEKGATGQRGSDGTSYWVSKSWVDVSSLNTNTWYPVVGSVLSSEGVQNLRCTVQLNSGTKPAWSTHSQGFSVEFEVQDQKSGWGTTPATCIKFIDNFNWTQDVSGCSNQSPVSYTQMTNSSLPVFYLRGGGKYLIETTYSCSWSVQTSTYTSNSQSVSPSANTRPSPRGTYVVGATGPKGDKGATGAQGAQGVRGAEYRGAFSSNPTSSLVNGDWYLKTGDGYCYYYTSSNSTWNKISSYSDYRYTQAMSDMINLSATLTSNTNLKTAVNAWVQNLVAGTALIEKLFAKSISVGNEINSSNYSAGSSGFRISSDGNAEFNSGRFRGGLGEYEQVKSWLAHGDSATITIPYDYDITLGELILTMSYSQYGQQHILGRFLIGKADGRYVTGIELKEGEIYNSNLSITTKSTGTGWYYKSIEYTITNNTGQSIDIYQSILKIA